MPDKKSILLKGVLNVPKYFFWELDYEKIDWKKKHATGIIERVLQRGSEEHYQELVKFYGRRKILYALRHKINSMPDEIIVDICAYFKIDAKELKCYIRKRSNPGHSFW